MKKTSLLITIIAIIILAFLIFMFVTLGKNTDVVEEVIEVTPSAQLITPDEANFYLYTSSTCAHSQKVATYISDYNIDLDAIGLYRKSLDDPLTATSYQQEMIEYATLCGQDNQQIGIPFFFINDENLSATERCLMGDTPIINYLENL